MAGAVTVDDAALLGALAAFRSLEPAVRRDTARAVRSTLAPLFRRQVATARRNAQRVVSPDQDALVGAGTVSFTTAGRGTLRAYNRSRRLSGGLDTSRWWAVEFGSLRPGWRGERLPTRMPAGRIAYPAVKRWAPTAAQVYLGVLYDALRAIPGTVNGKG